MFNSILVTGGAGFIGSNFILEWFKNYPQTNVVNLDKLTYASNTQHLDDLSMQYSYHFVKGDIGNKELVDYLFQQHQFDAIIHFAAESHVDNSIASPKVFLETNIIGTYQLLQSSLEYYNRLKQLDEKKASQFRFLHVSTDEVYGSLEMNDPAFSETTPYAPNSPYSASKASSDHLVRAWHHTYGLPVLTTNCSNNYGPYQFPEKLIPLIIKNALSHKSLPIYGDGLNIRDWLFVTDHCSGIRSVLNAGRIGETYNIGGNQERTNIQIVNLICELLDELVPTPLGSYKNLITFVKDRPGHDRRYAIDSSKIQKELNWTPAESFESGLRKTVNYYIELFLSESRDK